MSDANTSNGGASPGAAPITPENSDDAAPAANNTSDNATNNETAQLKENLARAESNFLYLRAEFDNYKKQMIKERSDLIKYGSERVLVDLLNVLDNFDLALRAPVTAENFESLKKGMQLTASEFRTALGRHGVSEVPCHGQPFDPALHEALGREATAAFPPGHISNVFRGAYKLHERLIRPAQVIIAEAPPSAQ